MTTITIWMLLSYGNVVQPIAKFATLDECQRVEAVINNAVKTRLYTQCVQATVIREN